MTPSLKQLEALHWVAQLGTFQAAAARLHTTQSAISKRIAELESLSGRSLFDRSKRSAQLTPEGQRISAGAQELLALSRKLFSDTPTDTPESVLRLGATELIGMTWLARFVRRLNREHPRLLLEISVDHGGRLLERMIQGQLDLALMPGPMWGRVFEYQPMDVLERGWMASPDLAIPRRTLSVEELSAYPIVAQYPDTIHAQLQSAWFQRNGFVLQQVLRANSVAVLGELVLAGLGIGQLPIKYFADDIRSGRLVRLRVTPTLPNVRYYAAYRKDHGHRLASVLARLAKAECDFTLGRRTA